MLSQKISKRDRLGIFTKIERIILEIIDLSITASLESKNNKFTYLNPVRIKIEMLKRFFRISHDLEIINQKIYIDLELDLQELSKMTNGWIRYLQ